MTSTTPKGLPYPDNTDPVTLGADAIRDLARVLDIWLPGVALRAVTAVVVTDAAGDVVLDSGLPECYGAIVTNGDYSAWAGGYANVRLVEPGGNINCRCYDPGGTAAAIRALRLNILFFGVGDDRPPSRDAPSTTPAGGDAS